ncbi:MAG: hypothetical protein R3E58_04250 [Phycisphaerae bacterium]|nr:hypothetical protein [Phycisphaerales bacterium]
MNGHKGMKWLAVGVVGTLFVVTFGTMAIALDEDVSMKDVPKAARDAILRESAGAKIEEVEREMHEGVALYEAEWMIDGREHEVCVTEDGSIVEMEESVPASEAPAAVRAMIAKVFGENAKVKVEKKMIVMYEVEGKADGKEREILVSPTGKVHGDMDDEDDHDDDDD